MYFTYFHKIPVISIKVAKKIGFSFIFIVNIKGDAHGAEMSGKARKVLKVCEKCWNDQKVLKSIKMWNDQKDMGFVKILN